MEFRYRDGDIKDPVHLQPTSSLLDVSLHHQQRPSPTESAQQAQLQYSHPQPRPREPPYRLLNERLLRSSSSLRNVPFTSQMLLVDSNSKETAKPVIRRTAPALVSLQEGQLEDLISRELESPLQVMRRPVSGLASLQRGIISREIERPLHVLHMQRREMEKERIRLELREQIRDEMVEKGQREYAEMRRVLEEEVRQELVMEWARGVGRAPTVMQSPHQPVSNFQHQESDFRVTPIHREREMGERMENPPVSMDKQLIRPSPEVTPSPDFPTEPFQPQMPARDEHHTTSQVNNIAVSRNEMALANSDEMALAHSDDNLKKGEHIAEAKTSNCQTPGIKRYGQGIVESGSKKMRTRDESWTCAVCQMTVISEKLLNSHLQGRKHKTRVEKFTLKETLIKKTDASSASKPEDTPKPTLLQAQDGAIVTMKVDDESHKVIIKNDSLWCEPCMAVCNTREMMVSHLRGKKHIQRLKKFKIAIGGAN